MLLAYKNKYITTLSQLRCQTELGWSQARSPASPIEARDHQSAHAGMSRERLLFWAIGYCFVAQKISPISSKAALKAWAASMSTVCFTWLPSLQAFQTFSCRSGDCARCSGLK